MEQETGEEAEFDSVEDAKEKINKDKAEGTKLYCTLRTLKRDKIKMKDEQIASSALTTEQSDDLRKRFKTPQKLYWIGSKICTEKELRNKLRSKGMHNKASNNYLIHVYDNTDNPKTTWDSKKEAYDAMKLTPKPGNTKKFKKSINSNFTIPINVSNRNRKIKQTTPYQRDKMGQSLLDNQNDAFVTDKPTPPPTKETQPPGYGSVFFLKNPWAQKYTNFFTEKTTLLPQTKETHSSSEENHISSAKRPRKA